MKIRIVSDLHREFHSNESFFGLLQAIVPADNVPDLLVVAGDISNGAFLYEALAELDGLCLARDIPCVYVPGNHEYWGLSDREFVNKAMSPGRENVTVLRNGMCKMGEQRILGSTLWFEKSKETKYPGWSDYLNVKEKKEWFWNKAKDARRMLEMHVEPTDVVVTHHLPHLSCIAPKYFGEPSNAFFLHDLGKLIEEKQPKLWIHGHTHESVDVMVGKTRIVCNPYGYRNYELNPKFDPLFTVEI